MMKNISYIKSDGIYEWVQFGREAKVPVTRIFKVFKGQGTKFKEVHSEYFSYPAFTPDKSLFMSALADTSWCQSFSKQKQQTFLKFGLENVFLLSFMIISLVTDMKR